jgi:hypothetical protein
MKYSNSITKRAEQVIGSLISEGYIVITDNKAESFRSTFLKHRKNGSRMRLRAFKQTIELFKNNKRVMFEQEA